MYSKNHLNKEIQSLECLSQHLKKTANNLDAIIGNLKKYVNNSQTKTTTKTNIAKILTNRTKHLENETDPNTQRR